MITGKLTNPFLRARRCSSGKQDKIVAAFFAEHFTYPSMVLMIVKIVHLSAAFAIMKYRALRYQVAIVHHAACHAKIQVSLPPLPYQFAGIGIGKIHVESSRVAFSSSQCRIGRSLGFSL